MVLSVLLSFRGYVLALMTRSHWKAEKPLPDIEPAANSGILEKEAKRNLLSQEHMTEDASDSITLTPRLYATHGGLPQFASCESTCPF
jgi:hypothetical protein